MKNDNQVYCVLDYETYSEADLKKVGAWEYSRHPSTEILCAAWRVGTRETLRTAETHSLSGNGLIANELRGAFLNPSIKLVAHNALFEQVITRNVLGRRENTQAIPPERWICTASLAASLALPRNLEGAAQALGLPVQKDMDGRRLMLKWCKPRKATKHNAAVRHSDLAELARLVEYCKTDVATEVELFLRVPPLSEPERRVWVLDQEINLRGFAVDRPLVQTVLGMIDVECAHLDERCRELTGGEITSANQRERVRQWLWNRKCPLPDMQKKTIEDRLKEYTGPTIVKEMIEIRLAVSKTSTAKYGAFEMRSRDDGRIRDNLIYHAASTGRWSGAGCQPQNFPRPTIKNSVQAAEILAGGDLELVRLIYGDPMSVFSSCLRNVIVAPPGKVLDVADYSAVETRVAFWIARHEDGLNAFREGRDLYREQAAGIFGVAADTVTASQRFVGKTAVLGCVFGMGPPKFGETCAMQGQPIPQELADTAVAAYRTVHKPVVILWKNLERAAVAAIQNPGKRYTINRTSWWVKGAFLWCELPSGRRLAYYGPSVRYEVNKWKEKRPVLYHWGVDSLTKKWTETRTWGGVLTENVVQATARDIMAEAMLRIDAVTSERHRVWDIVLSVHDELIAERSAFVPYGVEDFCRLMETLPPWAEGCPIKVEGWSGKRYKK